MPTFAITAYPLQLGRVHEACGPAAASFALRMAAHTNAHLLWVRERWQPEQLNPLGFEGFDPSRLVIALTRNQTDPGRGERTASASMPPSLQRAHQS